jgi:hypothetical protein
MVVATRSAVWWSEPDFGQISRKHIDRSGEFALTVPTVFPAMPQVNALVDALSTLLTYIVGRGTLA